MTVDKGVQREFPLAGVWGFTVIIRLDRMIQMGLIKTISAISIK
jgi:hypothetical protein